MPRKTVTIGDRTLALDARFDRLDLRDLPYRARLGNLPTQYPSDELAARWLPAYAAAKLVRNQGPDGACTGFGLAAVINYLLFTKANLEGTTTRQVSPAMLYRLARLYDEWPGEDYDGSSCRGALKGWHRHGVCRDALWPYLIRREKRVAVTPTEDSENRNDPARNWDVDALDCTLGVYYRVDARSIVDMQSAIVEVGAIYVAGVAHEGWNVPTRKTLHGHADLVRIQHVPKPRDGGGHAFALVGYNDLGFVIQNSWGTEWASQGFALLPYEDWVTHGEDAWVFTLGVPRRLSAQGKRAGNDRPLRTPRFLVPSASGDARGLERPVGLLRGDDAFSRRFRDVPADLQPLDANAAYCHTIVLDRGYAVGNDLTAEAPGAALDNAVLLRPSEWLKKHRRRKLMIYAHGGLNSEGASITRIRALAPYALANGIYPLFITWRSGALETVGDLVEELFTKAGAVAVPARASGWIERLSDKTDRLLEPLLRGPGSALWGQMKLNAERAGRARRGRRLHDGQAPRGARAGDRQSRGAPDRPLRGRDRARRAARTAAPRAPAREDPAPVRAGVHHALCARALSPGAAQRPDRGQALLRPHALRQARARRQRRPLSQVAALPREPRLRGRAQDAAARPRPVLRRGHRRGRRRGRPVVRRPDRGRANSGPTSGTSRAAPTTASCCRAPRSRPAAAASTRRTAASTTRWTSWATRSARSSTRAAPSG